MVKLSNNCGEAARQPGPPAAARRRFPPVSRPKAGARGPGAAVKGPARVLVKVWGPAKGWRAAFRRRKGRSGRGEAEGRLGAAAVAAVGLRRRGTGEPPPEARGNPLLTSISGPKSLWAEPGGLGGSSPRTAWAPARGLTASRARSRGRGQTGKLTPLLLRLELGELEAAQALESDGGCEHN